VFEEHDASGGFTACEGTGRDFRRFGSGSSSGGAGSRWRRRSCGTGRRENRIRRNPAGRWRQQDQRDQGCARSYGTWFERSQGSRRGGAKAGEGRRLERRSRDGSAEACRRGRNCRSQIIRRPTSKVQSPKSGSPDGLWTLDARLGTVFGGLTLGDLVVKLREY